MGFKKQGGWHRFYKNFRNSFFGGVGRDCGDGAEVDDVLFAR